MPTSSRPSAGSSESRRSSKSGDRRAVVEAAWLQRLIEALQAGKPARTVPAPADAPDALAALQPLTAKPVLFVANVEEGGRRGAGRRARARPF